MERARLLDDVGRTRVRAGAGTSTRSRAAHDPEQAVVCRDCGHPVTRAGERTSAQGKHTHRVMNPAGFLFQIGCYARAEGATVIGPPSHEYAWFTGFAWRFALCTGCATHIGWQFTSGASTFFGLRLDCVVAATDAAAS